jgi:DNA modification methylase
MIELYNNDNLIIIDEFVNKKIKFDAIITDPPYNVSRTHQLGFSNMGRSGMNYGHWDYDFNQLKWLENIDKIIKPGGTIIIFNDWKNLSAIADFLEMKNFITKDLIRWEKKNPMPRNVNRRYVSDCEYALWMVKKGDKWTFNKSKHKSYLRPLYKTGVVIGGRNRLHPTQKNLDLMIEIIKVHTNKEDTVFDPFMGSGTTGLACKLLNRNFVGVEIDDKYFDISKERLKDD